MSYKDKIRAEAELADLKNRVFINTVLACILQMAVVESLIVIDFGMTQRHAPLATGIVALTAAAVIITFNVFGYRSEVKSLETQHHLSYRQ